MKIAFTTKGTEWDSMMDPRFGRTEFIIVYDDESEDFMHYDNKSVADHAHGAGPKTAQTLFGYDPDILITGNGPGGNAAKVLKKAKIDIYVGAGDMLVREAWEAYRAGKLKRIH